VDSRVQVGIVAGGSQTTVKSVTVLVCIFVLTTTV
jgi:hypothetical protein